ncbi:MAG: hypothetical protein NC818_03900 [Candidatus Omnitrophica bacterium]|nr:hypothetical protein [Candidatus Omnitrophota bacterium]
MKKGIILYILLVLGLFVIVLLGIHYSALLKERAALQKAVINFENKIVEYKKAMDLKEQEFEAKVSDMANEREKLMQQIDEINGKLIQTQNLLSQIKQEEENLKAENLSLTEKAKNLEVQLYNLNEEKLELERKISSLSELRKALREAKLKEIQERRIELKQRNAEGLLLGNRGYLVKDGKPTINPKYIIHVFPPQTTQE